MSTTAETQPPAQESAKPAPPASQEQTASTPTPTTEPAQEPDWKAEARKWEARSKENAAAAARLAEIEEASKTEAQKAAERLAALEAENAAFKQKEQVAAWAAEVSEATGVPSAALRGGTKEELAAHAETLKALIAAPRGPVIPSQGQQPRSSGPTSTADLFAEAFRDRV